MPMLSQTREVKTNAGQKDHSTWRINVHFEVVGRYYMVLLEAIVQTRPATGSFGVRH
jgi:hypothetical protein